MTGMRRNRTAGQVKPFVGRRPHVVLWLPITLVEMLGGASCRNVELVCQQDGEKQPEDGEIRRTRTCAARGISCKAEALQFRVYQPNGNGEDMLKEQSIPWSSDMDGAHFEYEQSTLGPKRVRLVCSGKTLATSDFNVRCSPPRSEAEAVLLNVDTPRCLAGTPKVFCQQAMFSRFLRDNGLANQAFQAAQTRQVSYIMAVSRTFKNALAAAGCSEAEIDAAHGR